MADFPLAVAASNDGGTFTYNVTTSGTSTATGLKPKSAYQSQPTPHTPRWLSTAVRSVGRSRYVRLLPHNVRQALDSVSSSTLTNARLPPTPHEPSMWKSNGVEPTTLTSGRGSRTAIGRSLVGAQRQARLDLDCQERNV